MKLQNYLLVCTLLVLSAAGPVMRAQTDSKATVVGITGTWKLMLGSKPPDCKQPNKDNPDLHFASSVCKDSCVVGSYDEGKGGTLVMLFDKGTYSYDCDRPTNDHYCGSKLEKEFTCIRHIAPPEDPSLISISRFFAAVLPLFQKSPARYITPVARGLEAELADSVVQLQGDRVDLAPVLQDMDTGPYRLRLESLAGSAWTSGPVQLQWSGGGPAPVPIPGVKPGLYRLRRLTANGESAGSDAWVLVSSPDRFAKDSAAVRSAVEETKKWPDDVDARAPRTLLRAYLDSLSRQAKAEQ